MSFTGPHHVFASVSETGLNTFLKALFTSRPHYLNYGSSSFVPVTTVAATNMSSIAFPGVPGGMQWAIKFAIPVLDLFPDSSGGAAELPPKPGTFTVHTEATIVIGCATWSGRGQKGDGKMVPTETTLDVWALGELVSQYSGPGTGFIGLKVDEVLLPDIDPKSLKGVLECLIRMTLASSLENVQIPFHAMSMGAFKLILEQGPLIDDNQIKVWGTV